MGVDTEAILKRREYFPRGLAQPEGGYRFSLDSILLACFAAPARNHVGIDLGCGCGVIGLALLLRHPGLTLTGVELDEDIIQSAEKNLVDLHLSDKLSIQQGDVVDWRAEKVVDFVVSNPPYRKLGNGRTSQGEGRATARFESQGDFAGFARCAAIALKSRGKFSFVHLPERLPELMAGLAEAKLEPKRMRMVHIRSNEQAKMVLVEAIKSGGQGLCVEPPLFLYSDDKKNPEFTEEAKKFCPFMDTTGETGERSE